MKQYLKQFATSRWFDLIGVALVVGIAISAGYLNSRLEKFVDWGPWTALVPFGLISVINVGISMLSTRFTGQLNKWGNYLGIVNTESRDYYVSCYLYYLYICYKKMESIA